MNKNLRVSFALSYPSFLVIRKRQFSIRIRKYGTFSGALHRKPKQMVHLLTPHLRPDMMIHEDRRASCAMDTEDSQEFRLKASEKLSWEDTVSGSRSPTEYL